MRRRLPLNAALVSASALAALVLTITRRTPEGMMSFQLDTREVRAAPGKAVMETHDLTALKIFNWAMVEVKRRYVDPTRIDPQRMLEHALDSVQFNIPEVLVEPDEATRRIAVRVNDKKEVFATDDVDSLWSMTAKLKRIFRFIETNMNPGADLAQVEYSAINGMLSTLDPHSILLDPEAARDMEVNTSGKFGGLGIVIRMIDRKLTVVRPMKDTPAWRAGIKAGDHIVRINQDPTENLTSDEAVDRMRGTPGTAVTLFISRGGAPKLLQVDLERAVIRVAAVEYKLLDKGVGLIKVKQFSSACPRGAAKTDPCSTAGEVATAMTTLSAQGATAWVIDLRWNPGGLLDQAIHLSDLFVDSGAVLTTVSSRDREVHDASPGVGDTSSSVAVLVNGGSASASEIVAGALKNLDRAIVIGSKTFGKGSVQELLPSVDGSKLKLTVSQYLTPGDRSIQSVGIVPDIALQRLLVPAKNDAPGDVLRMLPPSRSYGEKDLDAHLTSSYARPPEKPVYELSFLADLPKSKAVTSPDDPVVPDEEEPPSDELVEDFEIRFARDLVASAPASKRPALIKAARKLIDATVTSEDARLAAALSKLGVDWTQSPASQTGTARLVARLDTAPSGSARAGDVVTVTGTVKNEGTGPAWRVLGRVGTEDHVFSDADMPFGKLAPGETRTFSTRLRIPEEAVDRLDRLTLEIREARGAPTTSTPASLRIVAAPRPILGYAYQLVDQSNGDGLAQRGESYRLVLTVKNSGAGPARKLSMFLRNASGDGVVLDKSRFELDELKVGDSHTVEFPFTTTSDLDDELTLEIVLADGVIGESASEKLRFALAPALPALGKRGMVEIPDGTEIRSGAAVTSPPLAVAQGKAVFASDATLGPWTRLDLGQQKVGFVPTTSTRPVRSGKGSVRTYWHSTPPVLTVNLGSLETSSATTTLEGAVDDDTHVEDVYVYVSNREANIDGRKVYYQSNRRGGDGKKLTFKASVPLWPGSNQIVVVARENADVKTVTTSFVYRAPALTAQAPEVTR
jgi:carboxyl-terminal processing protease